MGIEDFRLKLDVLEHDKIKELIEIFEEEEKHLGSAAVLSWMRLIIYAARNATDGHLAIKPRRLRIVSGFPGQTEQLIEALIDLELIEKTPQGYQLHDWEEHQPYIAASGLRISQAKKAARARWEKGEKKQGGNAGSNALSNAESKKSNAPTLTLTNTNTKTKTLSPDAPGNAESKMSNALSIDRGIAEPDDFVRGTIAWYNSNVCPPFTQSQSRSRVLVSAIHQASDHLREINHAANVGHEFAELVAYLEKAADQYRQGNIPCNWGLLQVLRAENMIKILDGVYESKDDPKNWAAAMKAKEAKR